MRGLLGTGFDLKAALGPLVAINGQIQHIHVHISTAGDGGAASIPGVGVAAPCDEERLRRLIGIRARLRVVPGGQKKMAAYLHREFGKAGPEDLFGADLERLYAWVHSLPRPVGE